MSRPTREEILQELARWTLSKGPAKWLGDSGGCILSNTIWLRDVQLVREILSAGYPSTRVAHDNRSPLSSGVDAGELEIVRCLVEAGANPNGLEIEDDTPLQYAVRNNDVQLVSYLLSVGADPRYSPYGQPRYLRTVETADAVKLIDAALANRDQSDDAHA